MIEKDEIISRIIADLGANFNSDDESILEDIYEEVSSIASNISNRNKDDEKLNPYIKKAVKAIYLKRGAEGIKSLSQSGVSSNFEDDIETLRNDIIKNGIRRLK